MVVALGVAVVLLAVVVSFMGWKLHCIRKTGRLASGNFADGISIYLSPEKREEVRECVENRLEQDKELLQELYMSCDNFPKYEGRLASLLEKLYVDKRLPLMTGDIVHLTDMCENGAISALKREFSLTNNEQKICCYLYWGFKWQQICTAEYIKENAYNVRCSRIRKKFALPKERNLPQFIKDYCSAWTSSSAQLLHLQ